MTLEAWCGVCGHGWEIIPGARNFECPKCGTKDRYEIHTTPKSASDENLPQQSKPEPCNVCRIRGPFDKEVQICRVCAMYTITTGRTLEQLRKKIEGESR